MLAFDVVTLLIIYGCVFFSFIYFFAVANVGTFKM